MNKDFPFGEELGEMFGSLGKLTEGTAAKPITKDSLGVDIEDHINDHIYGLLSQDELTTTQILLLTALMQGRRA